MSITPIEKALKGEEGVEVIVRGWVYRKRELKDKIFVLLRDSTGVIQLVFPRSNENAYRIAENLNIESSIVVRGVLRADRRAPGGREIHVNDVIYCHYGRPFPINEDAVHADSEYLLDVRHLWLRSRRMWAVLRIRHTVFDAIRQYFNERGYYEVQAPMFITAAVEGGATLFKVDYFGSTVYLTQSSQFYLEALIYSLEKVYTIAPSFRAEKSRTRRHLTEFWHAEAEVAWIGFEELVKIIEELVAHTVRRVLEERKEELEILRRDVERLKSVEPPFYRIDYGKAIEVLRSKGVDIRWGDDIGADEERVLTSEFDKPIFLYGFPEHLKAFYHKNDPSNPEVTLSVDLLAPEGYGEIVGGGVRIDDEKELVDKILRFGLDPRDYEWYIDLRRYGSVPHAGFGLGIDRLVMWISGLDHIRDAVPFPRDIRRVRP